MSKAEITEEEYQQAFYKAESDTVDHFPEHSEALCGAKNEDDEYECPLCYFSIRLKKHLGIFQKESK